MDTEALKALAKRFPDLPPEQQAEAMMMLTHLIEGRELLTCQERFLPFVKKMWPQFVGGRHHEQLAEAFEAIARGELKRVCISLPPRSTKALALDTPIPTPTGWTTMGELRVGDMVLGSSGQPVMVIGKSEVFRNRPVWACGDEPGHEVLADADHLWTARLCRKWKYKVHRTEDLARRSSDRKPRLPNTKPLDLPEADLPVPPYTLGVWLGDGSSQGHTITCHDDDQPHIRGRIEAEGMVTKDRATKFSFGVNGLMTPLREMGLTGNKHIPQIYLRASRTQRLALLQGLMDTDGCVSRTGAMTFSNTNKALIDGFRELVSTFGVRSTVGEHRAVLNGVDHGPVWTVHFMIKGAVSLPRKAKRVRLIGKQAFGRYLSFTPAGFADTQCITVDADDHLFLAGRGMIPTHNSEFASYLFPAWYLGKFPDKQLMQASHKADLAVGFGRKLRNLVDTELYREIFPGLTLRADSKAAGRWNTGQGGSYYAAGVGAGLAGFGADLCIIDDPHDEQEAMHGAHDPSIFAKAFDWYQTGPRQRLQPGAAILVIHTRWSKQDLIGRLTQAMIEKEGADKWHVIEIPALTDQGLSYWPEYWPTEELLATKANIPPVRWNAQYMQNPTGEEGALVKREWWKRLPGNRFPDMEFVIQSWDTAHRKTQRSDYSVCTTWGVFKDDDGKPNIALIDVWRDRVEFPELKAKAQELYKAYQPDACIIEGKAAGDALIQELRFMGIPVSSYTPSRGEDKIVRVNAVTDFFASGIVWAPNTREADELIEEFADFPYGNHDDMVDASTLALLRFRQGNFLRLDTDEEDEEFISDVKAKYY